MFIYDHIRLQRFIQSCIRLYLLYTQTVPDRAAQVRMLGMKDTSTKGIISRWEKIGLRHQYGNAIVRSDAPVGRAVHLQGLRPGLGETPGSRTE